MSDSDLNASWPVQYEALTTQCGYVHLGGRTQIELAGTDGVTFLNNLCTNDIKRLSSGAGCEAYLTTVQGKVLAHILAFRTPQSVIVETAPGQADTLLAHLDRYIITEDVQLVNRTDEWSEILVAGTGAESCLQKIGVKEPLRELGQHQQLEVSSSRAWARRVPFVQGFAVVLVAETSSLDALVKALDEVGAVQCTEDVFHMVRIESGFPWFPLDITPDNLPQEVGRDEQAISFTKGCYLGQETVARLDALGHVNRMLTGLRLDSRDLPAIGAEVFHQDKPAGRITSAALSPILDRALALAYVRCNATDPATQLTLDSRMAEVVSLPLRRS